MSFEIEADVNATHSPHARALPAAQHFSRLSASTALTAAGATSSVKFLGERAWLAWAMQQFQWVREVNQSQSVDGAGGERAREGERAWSVDHDPCLS